MTVLDFIHPDMPKHMQDNFIYRHIWNNINRRDLNATFAIIGVPGRGKSTLGLKICEDVDPSFNVHRVCYSTQEVASLLAEKDKDGNPILKPGHAVMLDEVVNEAGSYSRTALSKHNQVMNYIIANMRARRIILVICLPKFTQLDKDVREVGLTGVFQMMYINRRKKISKSKFKWMHVNEMEGNSFSPFPRLRDRKNNKKYKIKGVWFKKPSLKLENAYKKKKETYMLDSAEKWVGMLTNDKGEKKLTHAKDIAKEIVKNPEKFKTDGKLDYIKVLANFEVGDQKARNVVKTAETLME